MLELLMGGGSTPGDSLLAGTLTKGWYGEVSASNFITGDQLATAIGLTAGASQNSTAGWLKFSLDSKTLYVAKRPFRYGISWGSINAVGAVTGTKTITIAGKTYKVRLLKGRGDGLTTTFANGYDTTPTVNSEWNRLMYHVSGTPFVDTNNTLASEGISVGDWAQYSESNLSTYYSYGFGSATWCQDQAGTNYVYRGSSGVSYIVSSASTYTGNVMGWRPCLELVS